MHLCMRLWYLDYKSVREIRVDRMSLPTNSAFFITLHNVHFGWYIFLLFRLDISFNIYLSQLVRLEGKLDFQGNRDFQTLNLGFPGHFDRF